MKIVPYKGTTVTRLNREIVDELIYERTAVEARVLRDFSPKCTPEQRALIRRRTDAYAALEASRRALTIAGVDGTRLACARTEDDLPHNVTPTNIATVSEVVTEVIRRS